MLAPYLDMHDQFSEELPSYGEILRPLRARPNDIISIGRGFHKLDGWLSTDIFELWMRNSSEVWFADIFGRLSFLSFFLVLNNWLILFLQLESVFVEIDDWM